VVLLLLMAVGMLPAAPAATMFVAESAGAAPRRGWLTRLGTDWAVTLVEPDATIPAGDLVSLRQVDRPLPAWPRAPMLILANGDRVRGTVTGGDARSVRFSPALGDRKAGEWAVPLSALAAVWVVAPPSDSLFDPAAYPWAVGPRRRDAVLLRNGDVVRGTVQSFVAEPTQVRIKTAEPAPVSLPLTSVSAVSFDPGLARVRKPKEPFARLVTANGSRISLASASSDGTTLKGTTLFGATVEIPLADVIALDVLQGKATYLSDLRPTRVKAEPFNGVAWPWVADRSVRGNPLRLGGQIFDKGLGTHPRTTLTYDLGGKYRRFEAVVGLDSATGRRGATEVRVLVDGKAIPFDGSPSLAVGTAPRSISINVAGAKQLTLVVDFGPGGDVQDDVDWGDARLIR
jgi:hypothetical protein